MRAATLAFVLCFAAIGCSSNETTDAGSDASNNNDVSSHPADAGADAAHDSATPDASTHDVASQDTSSAMLSCSALLDCLNACAAGDQNCQQGCVGMATSNATMLLQAALNCAEMDCDMAPDGGTARCTGPNDTSDDCNTCFNNSVSGGAMAGACMPTTDPNCGHCSTPFEACLANH